VDTEMRTLTFLSPSDTREVFSCAAITARSNSRLGLHLRIQTGNSIINRKITFLSSEDRENFLESLECAKVMYKNKKKACPSTTSSLQRTVESIRRLDSVTSSFQEICLKNQLALLDGEFILENVQRVTNLVIISHKERAVQGVMKITNYRISFMPYDSSWKFGSFEVPLAAVEDIYREGLMLLIKCKDIRTIRLAMHDAYTHKRDFDMPPETPDIRWLNSLMLQMKPPSQVHSVFAFEYKRHQGLSMSKSAHHKHYDGWLVYTPIEEYRRLNLLRAPDVPFENDQGDNITWRIFKNAKFRISPTYPQLMIVPAMLSDEQLVQSAGFRSRGRLPVVVWKHPTNNSVLTRSSQPNYGVTGNRCEADRILLRAYRDSANKNSSGLSPRLHIVDARKPIATKGNRLQGKGNFIVLLCSL
jgi:myotubularin-related protein 1/2